MTISHPSTDKHPDLLSPGINSWRDNIEINRSSIRPLYLQVKEALEEWIINGLSDGSLAPGDRLPSENELSDRLGLSSITIKRSLDELRRQGLIQRIQGRGSFVGARRMVFPLQRLFSLTTLAHNYGMQPSRKVLEITEVAASRRIARRLSINEGTRVIRLVRQRFMDKYPIALDTSHLPLEYFPDLIYRYQEQDSLYDLMKSHYHREVIRAEDEMSPVMINAFESKVLEVPVGSLGIIIDRIGFSPDDTRLEFTKSVFRGDLCSFSFHYKKENG
jgi:GntR family transcriptional regulator